ncbi:MAG: OmpH family outer membrane protein [Planctomycetaceae bacterium]
MKSTSMFAVLAVAAGFLLSSQAANAQSKAAAPIPHKVGLIDMAHIFKNYKKFTDQREDLKKEIERSDATAKAMAAEIKKLQDELKNSPFKNDSPQKKALRQQLFTAGAKYQSFRQEEQQRFLGREAKIYKTVYLEVTQAVATYAQFYKYTLILRWSKQGVDSAADPKAILTKMNRLVIYSRPGDDITKVILGHLNGKYAKLTGGSRGTRR